MEDCIDFLVTLEDATNEMQAVKVPALCISNNIVELQLLSLVNTKPNDL